VGGFRQILDRNSGYEMVKYYFRIFKLEKIYLILKSDISIRSQKKIKEVVIFGNNLKELMSMC